MNRLAVVLIALTLGFQGLVAYKLFWKPTVNAEDVRAAPPDSIIDVSEMPSKGSDAAPVALVEFSDFECPFCKQHATGVQDTIIERFVAPGQVKYIFANYPLIGIHPNAALMASAAICAGEQNRYVDMHKGLFATQATTRSFILTLARELNVQEQPLESCMDDKAKIGSILRRDIAVAETLGIRSTPSFAVGVLGRDARVRVSTVISGAQPLSEFAKVLDGLLSGKGFAAN